MIEINGYILHTDDQEDFIIKFIGWLESKGLEFSGIASAVNEQDLEADNEC